MLSSDYLYGGLDKETARIQKTLFTLKRNKAYALLQKLKPDFNLLDFSQEQRDLDWRLNKIHKAIIFCSEQIEEADGVLLYD